MPTEFRFFGVVFHTYGLILGLAVVTAVWLIEKRAQKVGSIVDVRIFWGIVYSAVLGGVFGARLWHVGTDFYLYKENLMGVFAIWNGGLSILGGIAGGVGAVWMYLQHLQRVSKKKIISLVQVTDLAVFGLPFAQAIGRLANYVNQELYGLPTNGWLKLYIEPEYRQAGYRHVEYYHPLFLYEMVALLLFGVAIWLLDERQEKKKLLPVGTYTFWYLAYYSVTRFLLDFLRIDKQVVVAQLGSNQVVLAVLILLLTIYGIRKRLYARA